jgi:pimeloyl-ACP methyl ester carboxylesterase
MKRLRQTAAMLAAAAALAGCVAIGDEERPIDTVVVPSPRDAPAADVIVVLPGFGADAEDLQDHGVAQAIHRGWPQADVMLTSATFAYYVHGVLVERLEQDVIRPARARYRNVWLAGASVGGMGAILYERHHPRQLAGLVLFAPWLGDGKILDEVRAAGGVRGWEPGAVPAKIDGDTYQREMWRVIKGWSQDPAAARRVWAVVGTEDRLLEADRLLAAALPAGHYMEVAGGHTWTAWLTAAEQVIARIRASVTARSTVTR